MKKISVVVADDHEGFRLGVVTRLQRETDMEVVAEAGDPNRVLACVARHSPDVLILDVRYQGEPGGEEVAKALAASGSSTKILVLSAADRFIFPMLDQGVAGYLTKTEPLDRVVEAIRGVVRGEKGWFSNEVTAHMVRRRQEGELSERGVEVLRLLAKGHTNEEIGEKLFISENTVKNHLRDIYRKIGVKSRNAATAYAWQHGLMADDED